MYEVIRQCPSCQGEFRRDIERCPDCELEFVTVERTSETDEPPAQARLALGAAEAALALRDSEILWISELANRLSALGIPTRVEPVPKRCSSYRLMVREGDFRRASVVDHEFFAQEVPTAPGAIEATEFESCPSCHTRLQETASECPECGLLFPEVGDAEEG